MGKLIDRNGRLFGKISVIDICVVLVVLVMAMALQEKNKNLEDLNNPDTSDTSETVVEDIPDTSEPVVEDTTPMIPITFTIQAESVAMNAADALVVGDLVYDKDRDSGGAIGEVIAIEKQPGGRLVQLYDGTYAIAANEYAYNLRVTIRGEGSVQDGSYLINKVYGLGVNSVRNFHTPYTNFTGSVIEIG